LVAVGGCPPPHALRIKPATKQRDTLASDHRLASYTLIGRPPS
jgi:hypothetical protein